MKPSDMMLPKELLMFQKDLLHLFPQGQKEGWSCKLWWYWAVEIYGIYGNIC